MIERRQVAFFRAKILRTGGTSSDAALAVEGLDGSLPQIFSCLQNLGIPSSPSDCTLALSSLMSAVVDPHEKRPALPEKLNELHKEGKRLELKHSQTFLKDERNRTIQGLYQELS